MTSYYEPAYGFGGIVRAVSGLCRALSALGHDVAVLTTNAAPRGRLDVRLGRAEQRDGVRVTYYPVAWRGWPLGRFYYSRALARACAVQAAGFDVAHLSMMWGHPAAAAARICRLTGTPYILSPHGTFQRHQWARKRWKKRLYLGLSGRRMLRAAAGVHAVSPVEAQTLTRLELRETVAHIPNGIELADFADMPSRREAEDHWPALRRRLVLLFLSRLHPGKGLDQLIPAFAQVRRDGADALLLIAGPDEGSARTVRRLVEKHGLRGHVLLTGTLSGRERLFAFASADVFVLPSYAECFPMVVLEALACGLPAIITPGCNFPEVERARAGLVVPPTPAALAEAIESLLGMSGSQRAEMGQRARRLVESRYTWECAARKMVTLYQCVLDGKPVPLNPRPFGARSEEIALSRPTVAA